LIKELIHADSAEEIVHPIFQYKSEVKSQ
jgi:hypothetical protein